MPPKKADPVPESVLTDALAATLDLPASLGLAKLVESAIGTIRALQEESRSPTVETAAEVVRVPWKADVVAKIDALPDGLSWKAEALASVLAAEVTVNPDHLAAAVTELAAPFTGKRAVKGGHPVATALRAMGWDVARVTPDGDVIVRGRP